MNSKLLAVLCLTVSMAANAADLTTRQFIHEAEATIAGVGMSCQALAYRPDADTFLVIAADGQAPFALKEFRVVEGSATTKLVRSWGNLSIDGRLNVSGALIGMRGLWYDSALGGAWFSFGSWYANGTNNPVLGFVRLDDATGTMTVLGPWGVNAFTHSDTVKGKLIEYGVDFLTFGERGSTAQFQSGGPGLVLVRRGSLKTPARAELASTRIVHWPMKSIALGGVYVGYSDLPRLSGESTTYISGPASAPVFHRFDTYMQSDAINTVSLVDDTFVWTGYEARGWSFYGPPLAYESLKLESKLNPGQKMKSASSSVGVHAEEFVPQIHFMRRADVTAAYDQGGNKPVGFYLTADLQSLGGKVSLQQARMTGTYWNPSKRKFYAVNPGLGNGMPKIHIWSVAI